VGALNGSNKVFVSAKTGEGMDALHRALQAFLLSRKAALDDDLILRNSRQYDAVRQSADALVAAEHALKTGIPHEMVLLDLYQALAALDELTGDSVTDDILDRVFSRFCIGK
jgi:tRNA modification GTPase